MAEVNSLRMSLHSCALLLALALMVFTFIRKRTDRAQNVVFISMLTVVILNASSEIVSAVLFPYRNEYLGALTTYEIFTFFYFVIHTLLAILFTIYVSCVTGVITKMTDRRVFIYSIPMIVCELLILTNPFTHLVYYFDDNNEFQRNWGEGVVYAVAGFYTLLGLICLLHLWKAITLRKRWSLTYFLGMIVLGLIIQLVYKNITCELFAEALGMLGLIMTVETEEGTLDPETNICNRSALHQQLVNFRLLTADIEIIFIKITNMDIVLRTAGVKNVNLITDSVAEFLKTLIQRHSIYNVDPGQFVIIVNNDVEDKHRRIIRRLLKRYNPWMNTEKIIENIVERFADDWLVGTNGIHLDAKIIRLNVPGDIRNIDDVFDIINSPIPESIDIDKKVLTGEDLGNLMRRTVVEQSITRGLHDGGFEVYYQPTYYLDGLRLHGAEALLRLHDKEIGNVFPDEFIPVAEQMGLIDDVDDYVLECVCEFLKTGIPEKYGMDSINVNLSVLQCIKPGFKDRINEIVERYDVDKKLINFEVTESVRPADYEILKNVISELREEGYGVSMDDYGTGYSNAQASFSIDFDVIKIDKSILWGAEKSELGKTVLINSVTMIKQLHKEIVIEGVETEEQINMLKGLSVDYLQGYYFSKPVPKDELVRIISE